ncbi:MAG: hypothetical protein M3032_08420 [Verrucomicrobiota bacterium]|nr:hypothetical protein [Verrucomicrobiota bacterium]
MMRLLACALLLVGFAAPELKAQGLPTSTLASPAQSPTRTAKRTPAKEGAGTSEAAGASKKAGSSKAPPGQPVVTEIFSDEAFFDPPKNIGIFTGHVIVNDPRFNVQSDKMTIYLAKTTPPEEGEAAPAGQAVGGTNQALEKAVAEGNVGVVKERVDEKGGPPTRSIGRAEMAIYTTSDGNVELRGSPRVQSGQNTHVATSPDTVMVLEAGGQLVTKGPSRTEIRQQPTSGASPAPAAAVPAKR